MSCKIERRLAPFWKGLNDHSESWTEAQLVAAARGLPIPAADEVPPDMARTGSQASSNYRSSEVNVNSLTVPITSRSLSYESGTSANLSQSHPAFSSSGPASPTTPSSSTAQLFRGRAKTLASLATGSKSHSPDLTPQEIKLPKDPYVNGTLLEAVLYKDATECPICFMYYPLYLNKTRCCDQPICSECFVQIKRPDPHPPEHEQPGQPRLPEEEAEMLVSEVASCPFCVTPEFGVSYDPPPFRRGLAYAHQGPGHLYRNPTSAMSSTSSLGTPGGNRRRATSLSANAPQVITTDRVRPDWAKKLSDARAHALRRSAAATALHNAAYVLNQGDVQLRSMGGFRRRRTLFGDSPLPSGSGTPRDQQGMIISPYGAVMRAAAANRGDEEEGSTDLFPARGSSRRTRVDDLEDLMMMEAIRLSLAAEEDRKRREEKEAKKEAKKKAKEDKKEAKQAEKLARKGGTSAPMYGAGHNDSSSTWASTSMARSSSNLGAQQMIPEEGVQGKGKAPAQDFAGIHPLSDPSSTLNTEMREEDEDAPSPTAADRIAFGSEDPQRHLEASRANLQPSAPVPIPINRMSPHMRQLSNASSAASSFNDSNPSSLRADSNLPSAGGSNLDVTSAAQDSAPATPGLEPMLNFRSLAAMIGDEEGKALQHESEHIEHATDPASRAEEELKEPSPTGSPRLSPYSGTGSVDGANRSRGDSGESSGSAPPPIYVENEEGEDVDRIEPVTQTAVRHDDIKDMGSVNVLHTAQQEATQ